MFRFLVWHVLLVIVSCELFGPELGYNLEYAPTYKEYKPRDYHFSYAVSDPHTGDHKSQWEVKENGVVRGAYSLLEPDGTTRVVEYIADHDGFRAVVKKLGHAIHPVEIAPAAISPVEIAPPAIHSAEIAPIYSEAVHQAPIAPIIPEVSHYRTYDGQVTNYANLDIQQPFLYKIEQDLGGGGRFISGPSVGGEVSSETHLVGTGGGLEGIQTLQRPETGAKLEVSEVPLQVPVATGTVQEVPGYIRKSESLLGQLRGSVGGNLGQGQRYEANLDRVENIPLIQGQIQGNLGETHLNGGEVGQLQGNIGRIEGIPLIQRQYYEANLGRVENVPLVQGQIQENFVNLGESHLGRGEAVPLLQGQHIGQFASNLGRVETVLSAQGPNIGHNLGPIEARVEAIPQSYLNGIHGHTGNVGSNLRIISPNLGNNVQNSGGNEVYLGRVGGVPQEQYNLGEIHGNLGRIQTVTLPQNQGDVGQVDSRQNVQHINDNLGRIDTAVPGLVPIGPSYRTIIEYHGLTGNPEDDSRYSNDHYRGSSSQKVPNILPVPTKESADGKQENKASKEKFLIYYPEPKSH